MKSEKSYLDYKLGLKKLDVDSVDVFFVSDHGFVFLDVNNVGNLFYFIHFETVD